MAALKLNQLGEHTWYIDGPAVVGVIEHEGSVALIDSGNDRDAGRKISNLLKQRGWRLEVIYNTHSNADHIGGNRFLQSRWECRIGASQLERPFIEHPEFEPAFLWGGNPYKKIRTKFLMAESSTVTDRVIPGAPLEPFMLQAEALSGHFIDMVGYVSEDKYFFCADSFFPEDIIKKYHIFYIYDVSAFLSTLDMLQNHSYETVIPSHGSPGSDIGDLIDLNRLKIKETCDLVVTLCRTPLSQDELIAGVTREYGIEMSAAQYVLVGSTLRSYLSYLEAEGLVQGVLADHLMKWAAVG